MNKLAAVSALTLVFGVCWADGEPYQKTEPEKFWMNRSVFQKKGIVIEDEDHIVRKRWWQLDSHATGKVIKVEVLAAGVFLHVRFEDGKRGWTERGVNRQNQRVTQGKRTTRIRPDSYGDGVTVEHDDVVWQYDIQGEEVEPRVCGLILEHGGGWVVVRFPSALIACVYPRKGDIVRRGADWSSGEGGSADGGKSTSSIGEVLVERDKDGWVTVKWEKTGRTKDHRFDQRGYYDLEVMPP